jgi:hypothetical protein
LDEQVRGFRHVGSPLRRQALMAFATPVITPPPAATRLKGRDALGHSPRKSIGAGA